MSIKIAVIGATGNVGRVVINALLKKPWVSPASLSLFASPQSKGRILSIQNHNFLIQATDDMDCAQYALYIFNTEADVSKSYVDKVRSGGAYVIDSSSAFRLEKGVPLIVPPANAQLVRENTKLYAHANCIVSPIATALAPLHNHNPVKSLHVVSYQSVSGAGKKAQDDCLDETAALLAKKPYERRYFDRQIAFNVIPQVGKILSDGSTEEEWKIAQELSKVLDAKIVVSATAVRVPVMVGHAAALSVVFENSCELSEIANQYDASPMVHYAGVHYLTPAEIVGEDRVFVGRVRLDPACKNTLHLWLCSDNLRRGAATDCIEIAQLLAEQMGFA